MPPQKQSPSDTYAKLLLWHGHGYPLWVPEPDSNLPEAYRARGIGIGDLGILGDDGAFNYLFNICEDASHDINLDRTPQGFQPLSISASQIAEYPHHFQNNTDISTSHIRKAQLTLGGAVAAPSLPVGFRSGFEFNSSSTEGAILMLPDGGSRNNLLALRPLRQYAIQNTLSWYEFANEHLGREARNGSLYLVTGRDVASSWGVASFSDHSEGASISLKFIAAEMVQGSGNVSYSWQTQNSIAQRTSPPHPHGAVPTQNQGLFIRGFKIAMQENLFKKRLWGPVHLSNIVDSKTKELMGRSDTIPFSSSSSSSQSTQTSNNSNNGEQKRADSSSSLIEEEAQGILEDIPERKPAFHPSDLINHILLQMFSNANIAITHDYDWMEFLDKPQPDPLEPSLLGKLVLARCATATIEGNAVSFPLPKLPTYGPLSPGRTYADIPSTSQRNTLGLPLHESRPSATGKTSDRSHMIVFTDADGNTFDPPSPPEDEPPVHSPHFLSIFGDDESDMSELSSIFSSPTEDHEHLPSKSAAVSDDSLVVSNNLPVQRHTESEGHPSVLRHYHGQSDSTPIRIPTLVQVGHTGRLSAGNASYVSSSETHLSAPPSPVYTIGNGGLQSSLRKPSVNRGLSAVVDAQMTMTELKPPSASAAGQEQPTSAVPPATGNHQGDGKQVHGSKLSLSGVANDLGLNASNGDNIRNGEMRNQLEALFQVRGGNPRAPTTTRAMGMGMNLLATLTQQQQQLPPLPTNPSQTSLSTSESDSEDWTDDDESGSFVSDDEEVDQPEMKLVVEKDHGQVPERVVAREDEENSEDVESSGEEAIQIVSRSNRTNPLRSQKGNKRLSKGHARRTSGGSNIGGSSKKDKAAAVLPQNASTYQLPTHNQNQYIEVNNPPLPQPQQKSQAAKEPKASGGGGSQLKQPAPSVDTLHGAALEAQRQRELFQKLPTRSYSGNLSQNGPRRPGLLNQLMNPDPRIFPVEHPYRQGYSSNDVAGQNKPPRLGLKPVTLGHASPASLSQSSAQLSPPSIVTKSAIAQPVAQPLTASVAASVAGGNVDGPKIESSARPLQRMYIDNGGVINHKRTPPGLNRYRPKGQSLEAEVEDTSDDDGGTNANKIQASASVAQEKLKALAQQRGILPKASTSKSKGQTSPAVDELPPWVQEQMDRQNDSDAVHDENAHPEHARPTPGNLVYPYNLPHHAEPSSPQTIRRLMLRTEMTESLRQNLLWTRQLQRNDLIGPRRKSSGAIATTSAERDRQDILKPVVQLGAKKPEHERWSSGSGGETFDPLGGLSREETRRLVLTRSESFGGLYHSTGW